MTVRVRVERGGGERHLHTVPTLHGAAERHGHHQQPRRVAGTRGRAAGAALGLDARACARSGRARHSPQCQHMTHAASRSGVTHTELGPTRRARVDTRDARERTVHGPRSASSASAAAPGGPSGSAHPTARVPSRRAPTKKVPTFFPPPQHHPSIIVRWKCHPSCLESDERATSAHTALGWTWSRQRVGRSCLRRDSQLM